MRSDWVWRAVFAAAAVLAALVVAVAWGGGRARFFTGAAEEEPTRSEVPHTGTVPYGAWGAAPWAVAAPGPNGC